MEQLKEYILEHHLKSDEKLPNEKELADSFGVGRGTIREALHMLESNGIIRTKKGPGGGIFVEDGALFHVVESMFFTLRWEQISFPTLMEARKTLEDRIVRLASTRATKDDLNKMVEIIDQMESEEITPALFVRFDTDFHVALARASKNQILLMFMIAVKELHNRIVDIEALNEDLFPDAIRHHRSIFETVKTGYPEQATLLSDGGASGFFPSPLSGGRCLIESSSVQRIFGVFQELLVT